VKRKYAFIGEIETEIGIYYQIIEQHQHLNQVLLETNKKMPNCTTHKPTCILMVLVLIKLPHQLMLKCETNIQGV
jgi:hypothetical protein